MRPLVFLLAAGAALPAQNAGPLRAMLDRVSEEADVFRHMAPKVISQEVLVQRARKPRGGFPVHLSAAPPPAQYGKREIISEYGFSSFKDAPGALHEFRRVVAVDGVRKTTEEKARRTLTRGLLSEDDARKKRLLEDFEKNGLRGAAADFGQLILLFTRRRLDNYEFRLAGQERIGADLAAIIEFKQKAGASGSVLIFEERKAIYRPLAGRIWVRQPDCLPLRVELRTERPGAGGTVRDEAKVDYVRSSHGMIVPTAVTHRQYAGQELVVENVYRYAPFRMFAADAEIKFTEK